MATIEKNIVKPKIYTESDLIIKELREELIGLTQRVHVIEKEQESNRDLFDQFLSRDDVLAESLKQQESERQLTSENYDILAGVMTQLKIPVSNVVDNLSSLIDEVKDEETRDSLKNCIQTADFVLDSFNQAENYFSTPKSTDYATEFVQVGDYFEMFFKKLEFLEDSQYFLFVDPKVPKKLLLKADTIERILTHLLKDFLSKSENRLKIDINIRSEKEVYGCTVHELVFSCEMSRLTKYESDETFKGLIEKNQHELTGFGLTWMQARDELYKIGGEVSFKEVQGYVTGIEVAVPVVI